MAGGNGAGSTLDKFNTPWGVYVEGNNTIYIADRDNHRVQRWIARMSHEFRSFFLYYLK